ncbi:MAG: hypothetical protein AB7G11_00180 [Phycisphaerales bacterium]
MIAATNAQCTQIAQSWAVNFDGAPDNDPWSAYTTPPGSVSGAQGVAITTNALGADVPTRVFVTALFKSNVGGADIYTAAYDAGTGALVWERTYNNTAVNGSDVPVKIVWSGGYVYVGGSSMGATPTGASTNLDYIVLRYSATDGSSAAPWASPFRYNNSPTNGADVLADLYVEGQVGGDPAGGVFGGGLYLYATGTSFDSASKNDFLTVRVDLFDPSMWIEKRSNPAQFSTSSDVAVSMTYKAASPGEPGVFVTGYTNGITGMNDDYWTVAYPLDLSAELWSRSFDAGFAGSDQAVKVAYTAICGTPFCRGVVYVTGTAWRGIGRNYDIVTTAYDVHTGADFWNPATIIFENESTHGEDRASDMLLDKFADLYICGRSKNGSTFDMLAISYNRLGGLRWVTPPPNPVYTDIYYNGVSNGDDFAGAIRVTSDGVISHNGEVFILGNTLGTLNGAPIKRYGLLRYTQTDVSCP